METLVSPPSELPPASRDKVYVCVFKACDSAVAVWTFASPVNKYLGLCSINSSNNEVNQSITNLLLTCSTGQTPSTKLRLGKCKLVDLWSEGNNRFCMVPLTVCEIYQHCSYCTVSRRKVQHLLTWGVHDVLPYRGVTRGTCWIGSVPKIHKYFVGQAHYVSDRFVELFASMSYIIRRHSLHACCSPIYK
jgi:hypothetical protein